MLKKSKKYLLLAFVLSALTLTACKEKSEYEKLKDNVNDIKDDVIDMLDK